jgi:hypothetical protein
MTIWAGWVGHAPPVGVQVDPTGRAAGQVKSTRTRIRADATQQPRELAAHASSTLGNETVETH